MFAATTEAMALMSGLTTVPTLTAILITIGVHTPMSILTQAKEAPSDSAHQICQISPFCRTNQAVFRAALLTSQETLLCSKVWQVSKWGRGKLLRKAGQSCQLFFEGLCWRIWQRVQRGLLPHPQPSLLFQVSFSSPKQGKPAKNIAITAFFG